MEQINNFAFVQILMKMEPRARFFKREWRRPFSRLNSPLRSPVKKARCQICVVLLHAVSVHWNLRNAFYWSQNNFLHKWTRFVLFILFPALSFGYSEYHYGNSSPKPKFIYLSLTATVFSPRSQRVFFYPEAIKCTNYTFENIFPGHRKRQLGQ